MTIKIFFFLILISFLIGCTSIGIAHPSMIFLDIFSVQKSQLTLKDGIYFMGNSQYTGKAIYHICTTWIASEEFLVVETYKDGKLDSERNSYDNKTGKLRWTDTYKDGKIVGGISN